MARAIAVVEDDESIREMLRYYFQSVGYAVRAYESGEALFAGEEGQSLPALYILDIMLPGMDGLEILRRLREGRDTADVPVIMLTARTAEMDRVAGLENGADDYVVKPFRHHGAPGPGEGGAPPHRAQERPAAHLGGSGDRPRRPGGAKGRPGGGADLQGV